MCMALLGRVEEVNGDTALIDFGEIKKNANSKFLPVRKDDYVYVFDGFVIEKLKEKDVKNIYKGE